MGKLTKEAVEGCRFLNERSCTDCCMIPLALLFIGGWIAVAIVAYLNGNPEVLILPTDTNGAICGMDDLSDFPSGFYPKPSTLQIALCVASCPVIGSIVCDATLQPRTLLPNSVNPAEGVRNHFYNMTASEYAVGAAAITICSTGVNALCDTALFNQAERARGAQDRINTANCYVTAYPSRAVVHRCVPLVSAFQNNTLVSGPVTVESLRTSFSELTAGQFFILGFGEVETGWIVIAICVGASVVLSMLWILVMRWIMAPVVYLSLLMVLAGFVGLGLLSRDNYLKLEMLEINGDSGVRNQRILWETIQYLAFILAGVFVLLFLWLLKRIRISIELLKEGGRAFLSTPTLLFVPIFVTAGLLGIVAFFVSLTLYIQSIGTFTSNEVQVLTDNRLFSQIAATIPVNATTFDPNVSSRWLHLYNFFGFLWFSNYLIMEGLFIITMTACVWYFSATRDAEAAANQRLKFTPVGTLCRAFYISLRYHLGSVLFGALLIAIIQFIRAILTYVQQQLSRHFGNNSTYRIVMCCVNCCLWCLERIVKLISSTAFVIVCIKNTNFCSSCITALRVLTENVLRVGTLTTVSFLITTLLKILIAVSTTILGWGLLQVPQLLFRDGVIESGLFPLVFIFIVAYVIATMFISVYENCVDAIMICFFVDEMELEGQFLPKQLSKLVGMVADVQKAKKEFEEKAKKIDEESK